MHIVGAKATSGWPILCFYAFIGSIRPPAGSLGTLLGFYSTLARVEEVVLWFLRFLGLEWIPV